VTTLAQATQQTVWFADLGSADVLLVGGKGATWVSSPARASRSPTVSW